MNRKEINEIRRRLRPDKNNITYIHGCYVNSQKEIISKFDESTALLAVDERDTFIDLLRRSLSGTPGKNLIDIAFKTSQVIDSDEHRLLSALRKTELNEPAILDKFYEKAISSINMNDENYLIIVACEKFDVRRFKADGSIDEDGGDIFSYILCAVCPVKTNASVLGYSERDSAFHRRSMSQIVGKTEVGFMFPAFDDRCANIYNALYYSKDSNEIHDEFISAVFNTDIPLSAGKQKNAFTSVIEDTLGKDCSFSVIQDINEEFCGLLDKHSETKSPDTLEISYEEAESILERCGMPEDRGDDFIAACKEHFGKDAAIVPSNVIASKKMEIATETVKIKVDAETRQFIKTQIIDGKKYIIIPANGAVEINGVSVKIE